MVRDHGYKPKRLLIDVALVAFLFAQRIDVGFRVLGGFAVAAITGAIAIAVALSPAASLAKDFKPSRLDKVRSEILKFQKIDQRLQDVGWRLVRGNAPFCERVIPSIGLQLQDMASYGQPELVQAALDLGGPFAVQTAARGSPAARSGAFERNRRITAMDAVNPALWGVVKAGSWQRLLRAHDWIDETLATKGSVTFAFGDGSRHAVKPVPVCATRFEVLSRSRRAVSEGKRVIIGEDFPAFDWAEDGEFAGVVAHELAHNLLGHRNWLDRNERKRRNVRLTEREADRLMPWLLANAGYDPADAARFMRRWGKKYDGGLLRARTHDGWDERVEFIEAELPQITRLMEQEGRADWSVYFRREIDPNRGLRKGSGTSLSERLDSDVKTSLGGPQPN